MLQEIKLGDVSPINRGDIAENENLVFVRPVACQLWETGMERFYI